MNKYEYFLANKEQFLDVFSDFSLLDVSEENALSYLCMFCETTNTKIELDEFIKVVKDLKEEQSELLEYMYGIDSNEQYSIYSSAKIFNISIEIASRIYSCASKNIKYKKNQFVLSDKIYSLKKELRRLEILKNGITRDELYNECVDILLISQSSYSELYANDCETIEDMMNFETTNEEIKKIQQDFLRYTYPIFLPNEHLNWYE